MFQVLAEGLRSEFPPLKLDVTPGNLRPDIDFDGGTITIARNRVQAGAANVVENEPKTLSSCRTLPLDKVLPCSSAPQHDAEEKLSLGEAHADSGYVAVNEAGEPYTPDTLTRMWHKLTTAAGVRPIRLHDAR